MQTAMPLSAAHVEGARLFSDRRQLIFAVGPPPARVKRVAEIGVAFGAFSSVLVERFQPEEFHAIDLYDLHEKEYLWGGRTDAIFKGKRHRDWYEEKYRAPMRKAGAELIVAQGDSHDVMSAYPDKTFDVIYIDAAHQYEFVKRDAEVSVQKLTDDGLLVFNDYIVYAETHEQFGVVAVVNELVETGNWRVLGLGLHPQMYCDIALARR